MTNPIGDNEMEFRSALHRLKMDMRDGAIEPGMEDLATILASLLVECADETKACSDSMDAGIRLLVERIQDFDE